MIGGVDERLRSFHSGVYDRSQRHALLMKRHPPQRQARNIQQVVQQDLHGLALALHHLRGELAFGNVEIRRLKQKG